MSDKFNLEGFSVDENNVCTASGGFVGDVTGDVTGDVSGKLVDGSQILYSASGAISSDYGIVELDGLSNDCLMTLADPTETGVRIIINCFETGTGTYVVDIDASFYTGDSTATFDTGDSLEIISVKSLSNLSFYWSIIGNQGVVLS